MSIITRMPAFFVILLVVCSSHAASFDCQKASTAMEVLICSDPQLSAIDESLNATFKSVLSVHPNRSLITRWERDWLKSPEVRDCKTAACLKTAFSNRIVMLHRVAVDGSAVAWSGNYVRYTNGKEDRDSSVILIIGLEQNRILISGHSLWYGPNAKLGQVNTGEMEGIASVSGNRASVDFDGCKAEISLQQPTLVVESDSGCGGLNVTFVGEYKKK